MFSRKKKTREKRRLLEAGKRFCVRRCNHGNVEKNQTGGDTNNSSNNGGEIHYGSLGAGWKKVSLASMINARDMEDLVRSKLSLMSLNQRKDSRTSLLGYNSLTELKVHSISSQLPSPRIRRRKSLSSLGEVDELEDDGGNDENTKYRSTFHLERGNSSCSVGNSDRLSLVQRFSFRKKGASAKSPSKMAKLTTQKRSSSTPFESSFLVKAKPERKLSSLIRRKSTKEAEDDNPFCMGSILQRALMPAGVDEATRMVFNSSLSNSKQRRNAVCETHPDERNGLKVFLQKYLKLKQQGHKDWQDIRTMFGIQKKNERPQ